MPASVFKYEGPPQSPVDGIKITIEFKWTTGVRQGDWPERVRIRLWVNPDVVFGSKEMPF